MSAASASVTMSASRPSITERACLPDPPWDVRTVTFWPALGLPLLGEGVVQSRVEFARRIVGDVGENDVRRRLRGRSGDGAHHAEDDRRSDNDSLPGCHGMPSVSVKRQE